MNKTLSIVLIVIAFGLLAYNCTLINLENPLQGNSLIALIGVFASLCAIVLLLIYNTSKKIQKKIEDK